MLPPASASVTARVVRLKDLSPRARLVTLSCERPLHWLSGQHIVVQTAEGELLPYSIACEQGRMSSTDLELAVNKHETSQTLWAATPDTEFSVMGPTGDFHLPARVAQNAVFVAAGTGIAPVRAMIQEAVRVRTATRLGLLFGCRQQEELLFDHEFQAAAARGDLSYWPTLSRPNPGWTGRRGRVHQHLTKLRDWVRGADVFVCGPDQMVEASLRVLARLEPARAFTERQ